jgi:hypothetical protein
MPFFIIFKISSQYTRFHSRYALLRIIKNGNIGIWKGAAVSAEDLCKFRQTTQFPASNILSKATVTD